MCVTQRLVDSENVLDGLYTCFLAVKCQSTVLALTQLDLQVVLSRAPPHVTQRGSVLAESLGGQHINIPPTAE